MKKTLIYGGAFNCPHNGHEKVIQDIMDNMDIDKIILNPDGLRDDKNYNISQKHRRNMIILFVEHLREKGIEVEWNDHFFEGKNGRDTTIVQVEKYYKEIGIKSCFIFGTDVINDIPTWKDNENKYVEKELCKIFIKREGGEYNLEGFENYEIIESKPLDISSTKIKELLLENTSKVKELVPPYIFQYIQENNLYR